MLVAQITETTQQLFTQIKNDLPQEMKPSKIMNENYACNFGS